MSDLTINYGVLRREVGRMLGFDRDPSNWGTNEVLDVQDVIDTGLRQFYRPLRAPGERFAHQWSFLNVFSEITLAAGQWQYDLPDDFGGMMGNLYYVRSDLVTNAIMLINESRIYSLRQKYWDTITSYQPRYAAVSVRKSDGGGVTGHTLLLYPNPDSAYTVKFQYYVRERSLRDDADIPLGGPEHAETVKASCLAAAEMQLDDIRGALWDRFMDQLQASVDFDKKLMTPGNLGYNPNPGNYDCCLPGELRALGGLVERQLGFDDDDDDGDAPSADQLVTQDGDPLVTQDGDPIVIQ